VGQWDGVGQVATKDRQKSSTSSVEAAPKQTDTEEDWPCDGP
jgi:hypothetical protein